MKKISLLTIALVMLFGNWANAQAPRTALFEEFTQASCPNCTPANAYINPILSVNTARTVSIKYQVNFPGTDTMNLQNPVDPNTRATYYDVYNNGVPWGVIDGDTTKLLTTSTQDYNGDPRMITQNTLDNETALTSPVTLTATFNYNQATDSIHSHIVVTNVSGSTLSASAAGKLKLFVSLIEMNIHFTTNPPGDNGEMDFYNVNRKMYPNANGTTMPDSILNGDSVVFNFAVKPPSYIYNKKEMAFVAFVQDIKTSVVHQAVMATPSNVTDAQMVDNSTYPTGSQVCNVSFTPSLVLTNNGTTTLTSATVGYFFPGNTPVTQNWTGNLTTGQSTTVTLPAVTLPDNTYGSCNYFVNNYNNGALIDINDANNTPTSNFLVSIPATSVIDSLAEDFENSVGYVSTSQSLNSNSTSNAFAFIVDESYITNYIDQSTSSTTACGGYGLSDASLFICLACASSGQTDGLIFDKVNRAGFRGTNLIFDHAYARIGSSNDQLDVMASTDCGNTWTTLWSKSGAALATSPAVPINTALFIPTATQWVTDTVDVSAFNNHTDVIIQFMATAAGGNAMYVDNINWLKGYALGINELSNVSSASVSPNPANQNINLSLNVSQTADFEINIINTLGENVQNVSNATLGQGTHSMDVNIAGLASGVYNFVIKSNGQSMVKRFVVTN